MATKNNSTFLYSSWLTSPLGPILAIADESFLYLLEFIDRRNIASEIKKLTLITNATIIEGRTQIINSIEHELNLYFAGLLQTFKTPFKLLGTSFQQQVWHILITIPYGKTISYAQEATIMGKPSAYRAVANANGTNQLAIIIPCHRIVRHNGNLGGYGAGIARKQWLLDHEKKFVKKRNVDYI